MIKMCKIGCEKPTGWNMIQAINTEIVLVIRKQAGKIRWPQDETDASDVKTQNLTMDRGLHVKWVSEPQSRMKSIHKYIRNLPEEVSDVKKVSRKYLDH